MPYTDTNETMATNIEIIVGTYEQFLLGYKVEKVSSSPPLINTMILFYSIHLLSAFYRIRMGKITLCINRSPCMLTLHRFVRCMQVNGTWPLAERMIESTYTT